MMEAMRLTASISGSTNAWLKWQTRSRNSESFQEDPETSPARASLSHQNKVGFSRGKRFLDREVFVHEPRLEALCHLRDAIQIYGPANDNFSALSLRARGLAR